MIRICVFSGSNFGRHDQYRTSAVELGALLAERQIGLVYGGAAVGLMGVVAASVLAAGGDVIGVIPRALAKPKSRIPVCRTCGSSIPCTSASR